jgi:hypothetical protein
MLLVGLRGAPRIPSQLTSMIVHDEMMSREVLNLFEMTGRAAVPGTT